MYAGALLPFFPHPTYVYATCMALESWGDLSEQWLLQFGVLWFLIGWRQVSCAELDSWNNLLYLVTVSLV